MRLNRDAHHLEPGGIRGGSTLEEPVGGGLVLLRERKVGSLDLLLEELEKLCCLLLCFVCALVLFGVWSSFNNPSALLPVVCRHILIILKQSNLAGYQQQHVSLPATCQLSNRLLHLRVLTLPVSLPSQQIRHRIPLLARSRRKKNTRAAQSRSD